MSSGGGSAAVVPVVFATDPRALFGGVVVHTALAEFPKGDGIRSGWMHVLILDGRFVDYCGTVHQASRHRVGCQCRRAERLSAIGGELLMHREPLPGL